MAENRIRWRGENEEDLKGCANINTLRNTAKHEAGHAVIAWLMDRYLAGVIASPNGGLTRSIGDLSPDINPSHALLFGLAGIVFANEKDVLFDLRDHVDDEKYFCEDTDSQFVAKLVKVFAADPFWVLLHHQSVLSRLRRKFSRPFNELVALLHTNKDNLVNFLQLHELYGKWDAEFGFDRRPKSDFVNRMLAREHHWQVPKCKWLDWEMKPLENWEYRRPTIQEIALKLKADLDSREKKSKEAGE